ncbi:helix-turn-helix domain-containing protein [Flavihumibacter profundi]|uniref:helix-turn-helix domain-containing protein n=1 Tax=Flavihumibacter profundi TaxID=2716883 RepID=UPI001CC5A728|nr:helix-turn-helix domain-containing protein [Flavihumibacter profundi]MBZ5857434.1 helix-turn-helix domain-containing protein [Flavihumibacter profundi]
METDTTNKYFELASRFVQHTNRNIFLTGKAGTGKTTFLKYIRSHCSKKVAVVAPTGVAAINAGGVTLHTFFQLPLGAYMPGGIIPDSGDQLFNNRQTLLRNLRLSQAKRELMRELELLVIDEVSMLRADLLDAIDVILRHVRKRPSQAFGGVQVLFIGDLFQLPPVISDKEWSFLKEEYASPFFFDAQVLKTEQPIFLELKKIYRQNEQSFIDLLNKVRNNCMGTEDLQLLNSRYQYGFQPGSGDQYITLTTHNSRADQINQQALLQLNEEVFHFRAEIIGDFSEKAFPADEELVLKKGAQVMFIKNDKGEQRRFFNGKLGIVQAISEESIQVSFAGEEQLLELERETWRNIRYQYNKTKDSIEEEELGTFTQYPVRLAWAITIHKSQGLTFNKAIIDAGAAFAPGQVYVALSRLTNIEGLVLRSRIGGGAIQTDPKVLQFTDLEKGVDILETELLKGQQDFIRNSLINAFQVEGLQELAEQWLAESEKKNNIGKVEIREWALLFRQQVNQLVPVAKKTMDHLEAHFRLGDSTGFSQLVERTSAAAGYFSNALQHMREGLKQHSEALKKQTKTGKYIKELETIESVLLLRIEQIRKSEKMTNALHTGSSAGSILQLIAEKPKIEPVISSKDKGINGNAEKPVKTGNKKEAAKKGDSHRTSFDMYISGKSIPDIAKERDLAISTITGHLVSFVASGELAVDRLVNSDKIEKITEAIQSQGVQHSGQIKEILGDGYSYPEIKAVFAHLEYTRKTILT